jgi:hypothetical protein
LADDQVHAKIFHCGVKNFFDGRLQAVNFIEEENFFAFQRGENGGQVTFAFQEGAGAGLYGDLEFIGDDLGESGFAQARRAVEQDMIEGFAAAAGRFDGNGDIFFNALLADVFIEAFWADAGFNASVFIVGCAGDNSVWLASVWHSFGAGVGHRLSFSINLDCLPA